MKRARATALALVNWEGVFYERYLLNQRVTALEGLNGAGKTTVMIACFVVLLPDFSLLRFTSIGEKGEHTDDRGIWGRLGNPARPSYSVLEIALADGTSILAGVQLQKKAEPKVEAQCFIIRGLNTSGAIAPVLLLTRDARQYVPEITELQQNVARLGGRLQMLDPKEYFATLFELGVTPLRLAQDEERRKLNEMLRSSMSGGISRRLTADLRSFLLKEESGLAGTLVSMRTTLDSCRRTRAEVVEAQGLEQEISGVFQAGEEMFAAALLAERERASTLRKRSDDARETWRSADTKLSQLEHEAADLVRKQEEAQRKIEAAAEEELATQAAFDRVAEANALATQLDDLDHDLANLRSRADRLRTLLTDAERMRAEATTTRSNAFRRSSEAAQGLHNHDAGLDALRRRAELHRSTTRQLDLAVSLLGEPNLGSATASARARELHDACNELDREIALIARTRATAAQRAREFATAKDALQRLLGEPVRDHEAHATAKRTLAELSELEGLALSYADLRQQRDAAELSSNRQRGARRDAERLGFVGTVDAAPVHRAYEEALGAVGTLDGEERVISNELQKLQHLEETTKTQLNRIARPVDHRNRATWLAMRAGRAWNVPKVERSASSRSSVVL